MLSRLMKYEMRSQSRLLLPLHALLLLASILGRFFITGKVYERVPTVVFIILITLYLFSLVGISTGTQLFISVRFYQSLFSDEGYLAFTLPVTPGQHLLARTLVGGLWALIDTVIIFASFIILVMVPEVSAHWPELSEALTKELGMDSNAFFYPDVFIKLHLCIHRDYFNLLLHCSRTAFLQTSDFNGTADLFRSYRPCFSDCFTDKCSLRDTSKYYRVRFGDNPILRGILFSDRIFSFYYEELSHTRHCAGSDCLCDHSLYFVEEDQFKLDFEKIFEQQKDAHRYKLSGYLSSFPCGHLFLYLFLCSLYSSLPCCHAKALCNASLSLLAYAY